MKLIMKISSVLVAVLLALPFPSLGQSPAQSSSPSLLQSGRIRLVEEIRVSDKDLPESALFQNPRGVAVDASGNVYVSDFEANHIKIFGPDGKFRTTIGRKGQGPGDLSAPSNIEISGERIVVWEAMNRRFSILDLKGGLIKAAKPIHGGWGDLMALRALPDGRLAAFIEKGFPEQAQIQLTGERDYAVVLLSADLEPAGTVYEQKVLNRRWTRHPETQGLIQIGFPYHPRVEAAIAAGGSAAKGAGAGASRRSGGTGSTRSGCMISGRGRGKSGSRRSSVRTPRSSSRSATSRPIFPSTRMVVYTDGKKTVVPKPPDYIVKGTDFPETLPPYRGMIFDGRGRLWVQVYTPERENNVFDVWDVGGNGEGAVSARVGGAVGGDNKGRFLGRVKVEGAPIDGSFTSGFEKRFVGDYLWRIERDADGYASLVRYKIVIVSLTNHGYTTGE